MSSKLQKGFTLIELLVVIAVLGIMAAIVMVAINPGEQLARGRDASRKQIMGQVIKAAQSYSVVKGQYPAVRVATWINDLTSLGELKTVPASPSANQSFSVCTAAPQSGICYYPYYPSSGYDPSQFSQPQDVIIYTKLESTQSRS
ncbi:type II secretion system GspH family protein, partial [Patescibacteria group bacterium]|nr:type II secretion system GspH family protein [Patescibacteria group bacterium]